MHQMLSHDVYKLQKISVPRLPSLISVLCTLHAPKCIANTLHECPPNIMVSPEPALFGEHLYELYSNVGIALLGSM